MFWLLFFPQPLAALLRHRARNRADKGSPSIKPAKNGHETGQTKRKQHQYNICRSKCGKSTKGVKSPKKKAHSKAKQKRRHCEKKHQNTVPGRKASRRDFTTVYHRTLPLAVKISTSIPQVMFPLDTWHRAPAGEEVYVILRKPSEVDTVDGFPLRLLPETGTCANPRLEGVRVTQLRS